MKCYLKVSSLIFASSMHIADCASITQHPGWRSSDLHLDSESAHDAGSVTGVLRTTCEDLRPSLTDDVFQRCCDN